MISVSLLPEPELFFGGNNKCIDPQVGLLNYGPHGGLGGDRPKSISIIAGIIGTDKSINACRIWLERLKYRICAEETKNTEYKGIDFPGLNKDGPLGFEIKIDENCVLKIENKFIRALEPLSREERISLSVVHYCEKFDILREAHPLPNIILLPLDDEFMKLCKEPSRRTEKIVYQKREFGDPDSTNADLFDFHNYLKAQAALRGLITQMITPQTLVFAEKKQSDALIGWNVSVGIYYKATGTPWKLAEIDDETCYVGISFYNDIGKYSKTIRASIAQVYMRTGESQVIRGQPFDWDEIKYGRSVHVEAPQMEELIQGSIDLFRDQRDKLPRRVVVHKSTRFSEDELTGCTDACGDIDNLDMIHIADYSKFRAYHIGHDYPVVRGTLISSGNQNLDNPEAILFTTGYIPALGTYPGPSVPRPLHLHCQRLDTSIETVSQDILGLTKLDWNSSTFCRRHPVTIAVSRKVGSVMAEMLAGSDSPPSSYRFYM